MSVTFLSNSVPGQRLFRAARLGLVAAIPLVLLAGCMTSNTVSPTEKSITERILFANTKLPEQKVEEAKDYGCPSASILEGTAAYRIGNPGEARGVSHQASIHDLARECTTSGTTMRIKVGIQGRLILGDSGKPGTYTVPVRVVVRGSGQTIYSKLVPTSVTIPASDTQAAFVVIDDTISVPITAEDPSDVYSVLIGLDPQGGKATPGRKKRR